MIDALIQGKLFGEPTERTSNNSKTFATAKLRTATAGGDSIFVSVIAFKPTAVKALLALSDGDSVALAGELTPKIWTNREGEAQPALDLVAEVVTTAYHVNRKRNAMMKEPPAKEPPAPDFQDDQNW